MSNVAIPGAPCVDSAAGALSDLSFGDLNGSFGPGTTVDTPVNVNQVPYAADVVLFDNPQCLVVTLTAPIQEGLTAKAAKRLNALAFDGILTTAQVTVTINAYPPGGGGPVQFVGQVTVIVIPPPPPLPPHPVARKKRR